MFDACGGVTLVTSNGNLEGQQDKLENVEVGSGVALTAAVSTSPCDLRAGRRARHPAANGCCRAPCTPHVIAYPSTRANRTHIGFLMSLFG